jgi:hypothetical protein
MSRFWPKIELDFRWVLYLYGLLVVVATAQAIWGGLAFNEVNGLDYTRYNNYIIFKQSFHHLLAHQDIYRDYPLEHWDLYKYSPAFALLFGLLAYLPDWLGLLCWNLVNAGMVFLAVWFLPRLGEKSRILVLLTIALELLNSLHNEQSNGLMTGLLMLAFGLLERKRYLWAVFCIVLSIYIKLFGVVAFALFLFYPHKWKLLAYTILWSAILLVLPLAVVDARQLLLLYQSWLHLLDKDLSVAYGLSVMGWLKIWFNLDPPKTWVQALGAGIFLVPFIRFRQYGDYQFRLLVLTSLLLWVVIFNHKAESPSFIIAMTGVALWFFTQRFKTENLVLFTLAFVFTMVASSDLFPRYIRNVYLKPYVVKVVPCILVWLKVSYDLIFLKYAPLEAENSEISIVEKSSAKAPG